MKKNLDKILYFYSTPLQKGSSPSHLENGLSSSPLEKGLSSSPLMKGSSPSVVMVRRGNGDQ